MVNDGSDLPTCSILERLEQEIPQTNLLNLPQNYGKGVAVSQGLQWAAAKGFTHALQIDADGQHTTGDIPKFLDQGQRHPTSVIMGQPVFDKSIPKSRLWGRKITSFWVALETLSHHFPDTMCGFRLYPVQDCVDLLNSQKLSSRMAFDTEIIVRLYWRGVLLRPIPTPVVYPPQGISHFRIKRDNVLISLTHARLFCGMFLRAPRLLLKKTNPNNSWHELAERGSIWGLQLTFFLYRLLGRRLCGFFVHIVVTYFFLTNKQQRVASKQYLSNLYEFGIPNKVSMEKPVKKPGLLLSWKHFLSFGSACLDKISVWTGGIKREQIIWENRSKFQELVDQKQGAVLLSAHLGNIEVIRALSRKSEGVTINALMFTDHAKRFNRILEQANPKSKVNLIALESINPETIQNLRELINRGEYLALLADRKAAGSPMKNCFVPFLGKTAPFPQGPFLLASLLKCPIKLLLCVKESSSQYRVYYEDFVNELDFTTPPARTGLANCDFQICPKTRTLLHLGAPTMV